jgi:hypothetical protein
MVRLIDQARLLAGLQSVLCLRTKAATLMTTPRRGNLLAVPPKVILQAQRQENAARAQRLATMMVMKTLRRDLIAGLPVRDI